MEQKIYVFAGAENRHALRARVKLCLLGWRAEVGALLCPKRRCSCELLHIEICEVSPGLEEAILAECKKCGARGVFLDADGLSQAITELAEALEKAGLSVFSSVNCGKFVSPEGPDNVFLAPRRQKTVITQYGPGRKFTLSSRELEKLMSDFSPRESYSAELGANYFTIKRRNESVFVVYDTPETFRQRLSSRGENVFISFDTYIEYLGGRL